MRHTLLPFFSALLLLLGCATPETVQRRSSLSSYLVAKPAPATASAAGPAQLQLPLGLGIAFVPAEAGQRSGSMNGHAPANPMSAVQEQVADLFGQKPWTLSFKIIPALYLSKGGGFEDLD